MAQQKYSIVSKLDAGGMAEVWKGKATSLRGFEKLVAIKRVLPDLAKKDTFINMFLDEARLSLHLNHANVVQTFDIGTSDGAYFIVMEWVDGVNLKGVIDSVKLSGDRIPLEQAVFISIEVCKGLYHAHRRHTPDGQPLNIVHRDISPPNLLISREGEVKLVDFGLAKAATQALVTDQGMIKGKFSYLSPEAAWGKVVDERADIFAVGALLWEMLAGRRLFEGPSNKDTVLMIREAQVPSLEQFNPYVDQELMSIIWRSLAREVDDRYSTAKELGQDLTSYLFKHGLTVNTFDIAELVETTINEREKDRRLAPEWLDDLGQVEEQLIQFTSLEDLQRMSFRSVSEESGMRNVNLLHGEDPRGWAQELGVSFTPPPVRSMGGAQVDLSEGEGSAQGAFALHQNESGGHSDQFSMNPSDNSTTSASGSARRVQEGSDRSGGSQLLSWVIYVLLAIVLMAMGLGVGAYMPKVIKMMNKSSTKSPYEKVQPDRSPTPPIQRLTPHPSKTNSQKSTASPSSSEVHHNSKSGTTTKAQNEIQSETEVLEGEIEFD
jgi:serine/threonine-protein kinase